MDIMKVLLVDDHALTREEMVALIETIEGIHVVGQADSGEEGVRQTRELHPDLVVMDIVMPGMNGIEATREILANDPGIRVLALTNHTGRNLVKAVLAAGATGYVRKDQAFEELIPAIHSVAEGTKYIGAGVEE